MLLTCTGLPEIRWSFEMDPTKIDRNAEALSRLTAIIRRLRAPDGCPWDQKQTTRDIGRYLLDETYEVLDALEENDAAHLREELGDLLFQILFIAEIENELQRFTLSDVMEDIRNKMIRRHPHVFGDVKVSGVDDVKANWQDIKKQERGEKALPDDPLARIPRSLPALRKAQEAGVRAAKMGFDWPDVGGVLDKVKEEAAEMAEALQEGKADKLEEEMGDLLFTLVNLSRFLQIDAEAALNRTTAKFIRRFTHVRNRLSADDLSPDQVDLTRLDALWNEAKEKKV